jgi:hypothetical protein
MVEYAGKVGQIECMDFNDGMLGHEVGIEEYTKNLIGISREFHRNCMPF